MEVTEGAERVRVGCVCVWQECARGIMVIGRDYEVGRGAEGVLTGWGSQEWAVR